MQIIIDRFEGNIAVAEYTDDKGCQKFAHLDRVLLPGAKEGDVVDININSDETMKRATKIKKLMDSLFE